MNKRVDAESQQPVSILIPVRTSSESFTRDDFDAAVARSTPDLSPLHAHQYQDDAISRVFPSPVLALRHAQIFQMSSTSAKSIGEGVFTVMHAYRNGRYFTMSSLCRYPRREAGQPRAS